MIVLVTGNLAPDSHVISLKIAEQKERLREYEKTLSFLNTAKYVDKIVFCENSGQISAVEELRKRTEHFSSKLEILSFQGNNKKVLEQGKGYGEGGIIEYALKNSAFLHSEREFIKLTGRITIENLDAIIRKMQPGKMYFNPVKIYGKDHQIDTKFYKVPTECYRQYFSQLYKEVKDAENVFIEHLFWQCIREKKLPCANTPEYPRYRGKSASTGQDYGTNNVKYEIKNIMCKLGIYKNY